MQRILARRKQYPTWGARKLLWLLQRQWPRTQPFSQCAEPNDVWCVDF